MTHLLILPTAVDCTVTVQKEGVAVSQGNGSDRTATDQRLNPASIAPLHEGGTPASAKPRVCEAYAPPAACVRSKGPCMAGEPGSTAVKLNTWQTSRIHAVASPCGLAEILCRCMTKLARLPTAPRESLKHSKLTVCRVPVACSPLLA